MSGWAGAWNQFVCPSFTFAVFCSKPEDLPGAYLRYLENSLREDFDLPGTPIRINFRKGRNPYAKGS